LLFGKDWPIPLLSKASLHAPVSGAPFWFTPEGCFEAAEQSNGLFVERVMLRTERGLREIVNGKIVR